MLSTSRKKALESVPRQNNVITLLFKNWRPRNFHWQEECYFKEIWFFLVSIIVSTSENKSCKILFCLGEIVFFSIIVFFLLVVTIIEIMWKPIFTGKTSLLPVETVFLVKNLYFNLSDNARSENSFSQGKRFFNKFFIPARGNEFFVY